MSPFAENHDDWNISIHARDRATTTFGRAYAPPDVIIPLKGEVSNRSQFSMKKTIDPKDTEARRKPREKIFSVSSVPRSGPMLLVV
jgi:hypothetical protein